MHGQDTGIIGVHTKDMYLYMYYNYYVSLLLALSPGSISRLGRGLGMRLHCMLFEHADHIETKPWYLCEHCAPELKTIVILGSIAVYVNPF